MKENDIEEGFWVFVSHSTKDFEKVRLVRNVLEDSGFRPILFYLKCMEDKEEINDLLKREIDARRRFILCDSPNAQASKYVQSEVDYIRSKNRMYEAIDLSQIDINIISKNTSEYSVKEIEYALELDTSRTLPVIIDDIAEDQLPVIFRDKQILNLSYITSQEQKAKAIVEKLISFDLENQYK